MSALGNRDVMGKNIRRLMESTGKTRYQICDDLGLSYTTFSDWVNGNTYPRIDKIEMLANYFGVPKSALVEDISTPPPYITEAKKNILQFAAKALNIPESALTFDDGIITVADEFTNQLDPDWVSFLAYARYLIELNFPTLTQNSGQEFALFSKFKSLNDDGKRKLLERAEELLELPKYRIDGNVPIASSESK